MIHTSDSHSFGILFSSMFGGKVKILFYLGSLISDHKQGAQIDFELLSPKNIIIRGNMSLGEQIQETYFL